MTALNHAAYIIKNNGTCSLSGSYCDYCPIAAPDACFKEIALTRAKLFILQQPAEDAMEALL